MKVEVTGVLLHGGDLDYLTPIFWRIPALQYFQMYRMQYFCIWVDFKHSTRFIAFKCSAHAKAAPLPPPLTPHHHHLSHIMHLQLGCFIKKLQKHSMKH